MHVCSYTCIYLSHNFVIYSVFNFSLLGCIKPFNSVCILSTFTMCTKQCLLYPDKNLIIWRGCVRESKSSGETAAVWKSERYCVTKFIWKWSKLKKKKVFQMFYFIYSVFIQCILLCFPSRKFQEWKECRGATQHCVCARACVFVKMSKVKMSKNQI